MGRSRHGIIGPDDPTISYFSGVYSAFHRFIKEHVDALQPDKHNRYVYCYNNPINLIDPLGLQATGMEKPLVDAFVEAVSIAAGGAASSKAKAGAISNAIRNAPKQIREDVKDLAKDHALPAAAAAAIVKKVVENTLQGKNPWDLSPDYSSPDSSLASAEEGAEGSGVGLEGAQDEVGGEGAQAGGNESTEQSEASNKSAEEIREENTKKGIPESELGPSGKPKIHVKKHSSLKKAKDAARARAGKNGATVKHSNPQKGKGHFHGLKQDGTKIRIHDEFPY